MQVVCGGPLDTQRFTSSLAATPRRAKVWFSSSPSVIVFHSDLSPYELGRVVRHLKPIKLACHLASSNPQKTHPQGRVMAGKGLPPLWHCLFSRAVSIGAA
jgi:hypothetical protein